ncbi:hypothetical protein TKK_0012231 [Trichogramma kaykai]
MMVQILATRETEQQQPERPHLISRQGHMNQKSSDALVSVQQKTPGVMTVPTKRRRPEVADQTCVHAER